MAEKSAPPPWAGDDRWSGLFWIALIGISIGVLALVWRTPLFDFSVAVDEDLSWWICSFIGQSEWYDALLIVWNGWEWDLVAAVLTGFAILYYLIYKKTGAERRHGIAFLLFLPLLVGSIRVSGHPVVNGIARVPPRATLKTEIPESSVRLPGRLNRKGRKPKSCPSDHAAVVFCFVLVFFRISVGAGVVMFLWGLLLILPRWLLGLHFIGDAVPFSVLLGGFWYALWCGTPLGRLFYRPIDRLLKPLIPDSA